MKQTGGRFDSGCSFEDSSAPICNQRPNLFVRKRDGMTVQCGDWDDGDTSWFLNPMPFVCDRAIVGTMTTEKFDRLHEPTEFFAQGAPQPNQSGGLAGGPERAEKQET